MTEICQHDIAEMDTAIADGLCPICLSRRLREFDPDPVMCGCRTALCEHTKIAQLPRKDLVDYYKKLLKDTKERTDQAEAALEQITARCVVLVTAAEKAVPDVADWPNSPEHAELVQVISNLPASVEKLLAIKMAAEVLEKFCQTYGVPHGMDAVEDVCLAVRASREQK